MPGEHLSVPAPWQGVDVRLRLVGLAVPGDTLPIGPQRGGHDGAYGKTARTAPLPGAQVTWTVYIIETAGGSYYTGVTTDMAKRWREHAEGRGSRAVRMAGGPKELAWSCPGLDKRTAHRLESAIKRLPRSQKERVIADGLEAVGCCSGPETGREDPM